MIDSKNVSYILHKDQVLKIGYIFKRYSQFLVK